MTQRTKIFNDPVHGFIEISNPLLLSIIDSHLFQRLRGIQQLGLTNYVYPGATHSRFIHALGAMHLTQNALDTLLKKGVSISPEEYEATLIAILLHDIGHGPFSHTLENFFFSECSHEEVGLHIMNMLNEHYDQALTLSISIFQNRYAKKFLHQLVSSQLDMDRMDFLIRDSFFTGVQEGIIGTERIIKTLNVVDDLLVVEEKGIYSVEKFIIARRLMYWQVYLHKAVLSAEFLLIKILTRARELAQKNAKKFTSPEELIPFLQERICGAELLKNYCNTSKSNSFLDCFLKLDDSVVLYALKTWRSADDSLLRMLCDRFFSRKLYKVKLQESPFAKDTVDSLTAHLRTGNPNQEALPFLAFTEKVSNTAYAPRSEEPIYILKKTGAILDILDASDLKNIEALSPQLTKHVLCYFPDDCQNFLRQEDQECTVPPE